MQPAAIATALLLAVVFRGQEPQPAAAQGSLRERAAAAENSSRFAEAADLYLRLCAAEPSRAEWVVAAGRCLGRSGRFNDAIDLLQTRRKDFPGVLDLPAMLARTHLLKVESDPGALNPRLSYADAVQLAEEVLTLDPDHPEAGLILAQARYGLGDEDGAIRAAEAAAERRPQHAGAQILIGRIAFDSFRRQKRALQQAQPDEQEHARAVAAIDEQRQRARAAFTRAVELEPQRTFARIALGELAVWDQLPDEALAHWQAALVADPLARVDHEWIGREIAPLKRREFYEQAFARYRERDGADPRVAATLQWYAARAIYDLGDPQAAASAFAAVLAANPEHTNAHYWLALCAFATDDHDTAEQHAARYAELSATAFADVLRALQPERRGELSAMVRYLGDRAYQQGRIDHSRDLNHVIACLEDSADAWNNHAFLCRETGRFDDAFASYQHALEKEPDSAQLWNDAAVILQYHLPTPEHLEQARQMYGRALELAQRTLDDAGSSSTARQRAQQAISDARRNLEALPPR